MKRRFLAAMLPGVVLVCGAVVAMSLTALERWTHQADVPADLAFAAPVIPLLEANHLHISRVYRAGHYERDGIRAAGIKTNRGIAIVMNVPNTDAAQQTVDAIARSFGTDARVFGPDGTLLIAEPLVLAALRSLNL